MNNIPQQQNQQEKPKKEWQFMQTSSIASSQSQSTHHPNSDVIGAIQLHQSHSLLATAGISRKIRLYNLLPNHHHHHNNNNSSSSLSHTFYISTPAKLSSLKFHPSPNPTLIAAADYDGVVTEYDLATKIPTSERDEHGGRRVWSIDYSPTCGLAASASDDCTAHLWDPRTAATASVVGFRAAACCVRFDEGDGGSRYVAVGCADRCAYVYDVRRMDAAVARLEGHGRTVTYVRFAEGGRMVTSSVDGCHRMWDLREGGGCVRAYAGHRNSRSFVGMDVCRSAGLIGCGSESNEVFVYDLRWGDPVWKDGFEERAEGEEEEGRGFVSAVCWKEVSPDECVLFAAGSSGDVKMFVGKKKIECDD